MTQTQPIWPTVPRCPIGVTQRRPAPVNAYAVRAGSPGESPGDPRGIAGTETRGTPGPTMGIDCSPGRGRSRLKRIWIKPPPGAGGAGAGGRTRLPGPDGPPPGRPASTLCRGSRPFRISTELKKSTICKVSVDESRLPGVVYLHRDSPTTERSERPAGNYSRGDSHFGELSPMKRSKR